MIALPKTPAGLSSAKAFDFIDLIVENHSSDPIGRVNLWKHSIHRATIPRGRGV